MSRVTILEGPSGLGNWTVSTGLIENFSLKDRGRNETNKWMRCIH